MVRFERIKTKKTVKAIEALKHAKTNTAPCNTPEVLDALKEVFHGKCYICELDEGVEVEHLHPHKGDLELKYSWDNLYLSCHHCNQTKSYRYEPILDCCIQDVDMLIAFRKKGYFGIEEKYTFTPVTQTKSIEVDNTCLLLQNVFYGKTPQKELESRRLRRKLRDEITDFKKQLRNYKEDEGVKKEDERLWIIQQLRNTSSFTAFKRWLIRDNIEQFSEFREYV